MEGARAARAPAIKVWDMAVRLFHWSLVLAMAYEFIFEPGTFLHNTIGQIILGLIAFRLVWGFIGSRHARFSDFVSSPSRVIGYLADIMKGQPRRFLGHNPAGGAMVLALLCLVALTAGTGWAMTTDALWGEEWIEELHETLAWTTACFIGLHVAGVLLASLQHRENLVRAMLTGMKKADGQH